MDYHLTIKDLPEGERPRERLMRLGPESLSDAELIALIIQTGSREETSVQLAQRLLTEGGRNETHPLRHLVSATAHELARIRGIGPAKAAQIKAAVELGRRIGAESGPRSVIRSPQDAAGLLMENMRFLDREHFQIILLNTKNQVLGIELVSVGSLNASIVHPREIFKIPIRRSAAAIILVHNHPSGDPTPSQEDIDVTRRLREAGKILGIDVLDHVIIGDRRYLSFREKGLEWAC